MLEIFDWMLAIDNFILLSAGYFCILVTIYGICSRIQIQIRNSLIPWALILRYFRQDWAAFILELIFLLSWGKDFYKTLSDALWILTFSTQASGIRNYFLLCVSPSCVLSYPSDLFIDWPRISSPTCDNQYEAEDSRKTVCRHLEVSVCAAFSSLPLCPEKGLPCSPRSPLHLLPSERTPGICIPPSCTAAWSFSQGCNLVSHSTIVYCLGCFIEPVCPGSISFFRWKYKSYPYYSIGWSGSRL